MVALTTSLHEGRVDIMIFRVARVFGMMDFSVIRPRFNPGSLFFFQGLGAWLGWKEPERKQAIRVL